MAKKTKRKAADIQKQTVKCYDSSERLKPIWIFDSIDRNGRFAFDLDKAGFDHKDFLSKVISYSSMTWAEIRGQTHDDQRSKHHFLGIDQLSSEAKERIQALHLEDDTDSIYSFAFNNKTRIIGIRDREKFIVKWYDAEHLFCPSHKKHT